MALNEAKQIPLEQELPSIPVSFHKKKKGIFEDNLEHVESLEYLSRLKLARAYLTNGYTADEFPDLEDPMDQAGGGVLDLLGLKINRHEIEPVLQRLEEEIPERAERSFNEGIKLHFEQLCRSYDLDDIERDIVSLLLANNTGKSFRRFYEKSEFDLRYLGDGGMSIGAILSIIHMDYRKQISDRQYFSIDAPLIKQEIVIPFTRYDNITNILDVYVHLHERMVRYLIGDNNIYDVTLDCISRNRHPVEMDQVILPEGTKKEILKLAENYVKSQATGNKSVLDQFFGYGTGLIFLFHGPSGTGKTMLAHALATSLGKDLFSLNMDQASEVGKSPEDLVKHVFKEAKLNDAIVFFDECDEMFYPKTSESRALLIEIEKSKCITIMATNRTIEMEPALDRRITMKVQFFLPDEKQREKIWEIMVPPNVSLEKDVGFRSFAKNYVFSGGLIKNAMFAAVTNAISKNGESKIRLKASDIEEAAKWQTVSMFDLNQFEKSYLPDSRVQSLPIGRQDKRKIETLANAFTDSEHKTSGLKILLGCSDVQTGIDVVGAVAGECGIKVREFSLDDILLTPDKALNIVDPMTRQEMDLFDYIFKNKNGSRSIILMADRNNLLEPFFLDVDVKSAVPSSFRFFSKLDVFDGLFFLATTPIRKSCLPSQFSTYLEIHPPPEELQIRKWEEFLGKNNQDEQKLVNLVEKHPLHLNEISEVIQKSKTTALVNGNGAIGIEDVLETLKRLKGNKSTETLFGHRIT